MVRPDGQTINSPHSSIQGMMGLPQGRIGRRQEEATSLTVGLLCQDKKGFGAHLSKCSHGNHHPRSGKPCMARMVQARGWYKVNDKRA